MRYVKAFSLLVLFTAGVLSNAQPNKYQTSDPYFGTVEVAIDTNGFPAARDSAMLVVELANVFGPWKMVYYRNDDAANSVGRLGPLNPVAALRLVGAMNYVVSPGLYTVAVTNSGPGECYSWMRCSQIPLLPGSITRILFTPRYRTSDDDLPIPEFDYVESKLHSLIVVPSSASELSKPSLTIQIRDSLRVSYPFGAAVVVSRGSGVDLTASVHLISDTVSTITLDTGEVRVSITSRFRSSALLQLPKPVLLRPGDSAIVNITLGGAYTLDSSASWDGYQRDRHFYGTTSVRHELVEEASSRDSAFLALEVVDSETKHPIKHSHARVYEQCCDREWTVTNGQSSIAVPTGSYTVECDPTGPERCWYVSREGILVIPGQRTVVRFEMNMKQSRP